MKFVDSALVAPWDGLADPLADGLGDALCDGVADALRDGPADGVPVELVEPATEGAAVELGVDAGADGTIDDTWLWPQPVSTVTAIATIAPVIICRPGERRGRGEIIELLGTRPDWGVFWP